MNRNETTETQEMKPPQGPLVPATYGQPIAQPVPIMTTVPVPVAVQVAPPDKQGGLSHIDPDKIKTTPLTVQCPFCKKVTTTKVDKSLNVCACLLCYCTGIVFYVCVQAIRKKDLCCWNAEHRCAFCGNVVGAYTSC